MVRWLVAAIAVLLPFSSLPSSGAAPGRWCGGPIKTGTDTVTLAGVIKKKVVWGPPNFGEDPKNDRKETAWTLALDYPVPVQKNHEFSSKGDITEIETIQIHASPQLFEEVVSRLSRRAVVTGILLTAVFPTDVTSVTMQAVIIHPASAQNPTCNGSLHKRPT